MIPHALTTDSKAKTYLMIHSFLPASISTVCSGNGSAEASTRYGGQTDRTIRDTFLLARTGNPTRAKFLCLASRQLARCLNNFCLDKWLLPRMAGQRGNVALLLLSKEIYDLCSVVP